MADDVVVVVEGASTNGRKNPLRSLIRLTRTPRASFCRSAVASTSTWGSAACSAATRLVPLAWRARRGPTVDRHSSVPSATKEDTISQPTMRAAVLDEPGTALL